MEAISQLVAVIDYLVTVRDRLKGNKVRCYDLIDRCRSLQPTLQELVQHLKDVVSKEHCFSRLLLVITQAKTYCEKFLKKQNVRRLFVAFRGDAEFEELNKKLDSACGDLKLELVASSVRHDVNNEAELAEVKVLLREFICVNALTTLPVDQLKGRLLSAVEHSCGLVVIARTRLYPHQLRVPPHLFLQCLRYYCQHRSIALKI